MGGAFANSAAGGGYALLNRSAGCTEDAGPDALGEVVEAQSGLLVGVGALAATHAVQSSAPVVQGAVVVARWGGGAPLVVRGARGGRTLVEVNLFPASVRNWAGFWTGDGAALLRNALKHSRCLVCGPGTFPAAGEARPAAGGAMISLCLCCTIQYSTVQNNRITAAAEARQYSTEQYNNCRR